MSKLRTAFNAFRKSIEEDPVIDGVTGVACALSLMSIFNPVSGGIAACGIVYETGKGLYRACQALKNN